MVFISTCVITRRKKNSGKGLGEFVKFFNEERIYQSFDYQASNEVYIQGTFPMEETEKKAA